MRQNVQFRGVSSLKGLFIYGIIGTKGHVGYRGESGLREFHCTCITISNCTEKFPFIRLQVS